MCYTCYMCSGRAGGSGKGMPVSAPHGPAPEFVGVCALWEGGFGHPKAAAFPARHSSWLCLALPSLCLHQGTIPSCWMEAAAGRHPGGSSSALLPRAADRTSASHSHESPFIPAWNRLPTGSGKSRGLCGLAEMGQGEEDLGDLEALGWEMVVQRNLNLSQAPALSAPSPYPNAPREGETEKGSPYTNFSQRILA